MRRCHQLQLLWGLALGAATATGSLLAIDGLGKLKSVNELSQFVSRKAKADKGTWISSGSRIRVKGKSSKIEYAAVAQPSWCAGKCTVANRACILSGGSGGFQCSGQQRVREEHGAQQTLRHRLRGGQVSSKNKIR